MLVGTTHGWEPLKGQSDVRRTLTPVAHLTCRGFQWENLSRGRNSSTSTGRNSIMDSGGTGASATFGQRLQRMKQRGCNLLVVGSVPDSVLSLASNQMLGDSNLRRHRLFVLTDADTSTVRGRLPAASTRPLSQMTKIVDHVPSARTATTQTGAATEPIPVERVYDDGLDVLCEVIVDTITTFERNEGGFDAGRFRLCFDSLRPIVDEYDSDELSRFLDRLTTEIRGVQGMGHFILPVAREVDVVSQLEPSFDAVVELRTVNDSREQERWHLPEDNLTTDWITL